MRSTVLVTEPDSEPVTRDEIKTQLRIDHSDEDTFIDGLITAARKYVEEATFRALVTQTWKLNLEAWPTGDEIEIPKPPLQSVSSVVYLDEAGASTTWASSNYIVDADSPRGRVVLANNKSWPTETLYAVNPIQITFVAGYGLAAAVPAQLKHCIKLLIGHWYEHREGTITGTVAREVTS